MYYKNIVEKFNGIPFLWYIMVKIELNNLKHYFVKSEYTQLL